MKTQLQNRPRPLLLCALLCTHCGGIIGPGETTAAANGPQENTDDLYPPAGDSDPVAGGDLDAPPTGDTSTPPSGDPRPSAGDEATPPPGDSIPTFSPSNPFIFRQIDCPNDPACTDPVTGPTNCPCCYETATNIMRFVTKRSCGGCLAQQRGFEQVMAEYDDRVTTEIWDTDQWAAVPETEQNLCVNVTDDHCIAPTTILGCRYYLLANGPEGSMPYQDAVREVVDYLLLLDN